MRKRLKSVRKAFVDTSVILRILVEDDPQKRSACEMLLRGSLDKGILLCLLPVAVLEIVWVLEKVYKFKKSKIREIVEAIINTPELLVERGEVFLQALKDYEEKNIKFADAVMAHWGMESSCEIVYTYDEKDFKRISGLEVRKP